MRARDLGIIIGTLSPGPNDAITDVAGVRVGSTTLIEEEPSRLAGRAPIHTGVTVVMPLEGNIWKEPLFAGCHSLNGNGEMTGLEWDKQIGVIVIEHWDRLTRFGFAYIEQLLQMQGRRIEVMFPTDTNHDLVDDFMAVITSMASRLYGRRHSKERAEKIKACVEQVMKQEENA